MIRSIQILMDIETAEAIDIVRTDVRRVENSLTDKIKHVETSLTAKIERVETSLTAKIEHVEASLTARIEHVETSLTARMHELHDDAKRHSDVQIENVRDDIRMLAEGFATLSVEVRSLRR
jgi:phage-related minor tail protein